MVTSIQSNSQPGGGMTATQPIVPAANLTPADIQAIVEQLTPIQSRFRQQSSFLEIALDQANFTALGQQKPVQIRNVGLGVQLRTEWNVTITVANGSTAAQTFVVSPAFPLNLITNTQIQINGGATVYSASGLGGLDVETRQRRGSRKFTAQQTLWNAALGLSLDPAILQVNTLGSNLTATNSAATTANFTGVTSISVAGSASTNNTWVLRFVTIEKVAYDYDSLLGALPLQNNSTFIQVARQIVGALSGTRNDFNMPFSSAGGNLTFTLTTLTADSTYQFVSVPSDPSLYAGMIANSYQVQEQQAISVTSTGSKAFVYNIPQNLFLVAAHIRGVDTNGAFIKGYDSSSGLGDLYVQYNGGSIIPVTQKVYRARAHQYMSYDFDPVVFLGYRLWDGDDTSDDIVSTDNMGWLDTYATASPQIAADVGSSASTNLTMSVCREQVVAGAVQQVGG